MKFLARVLSKKQLKDNFELFSGVIVGIKGFSHQVVSLDINEIKELDIDNLYIDLNNIIHEEKIESLREILTFLSSINIKGLFFEDIAVFNIVTNNNLHIPLIWNQAHFVTNYESINIWASLGVSGVKIANEITLDEIKEIAKNSAISLYYTAIGNLQVASSNREFLTNYFEYIDEKKEEDNYHILENISNQAFIIEEEDNNSYLYTKKIFNALGALNNIENIDYLIIDLVFKMEKIKELLGGKEMNSEEFDTFFLYKKTIYKVKQNE